MQMCFKNSKAEIKEIKLKVEDGKNGMLWRQQQIPVAI